MKLSVSSVESFIQSKTKFAKKFACLILIYNFSVYMCLISKTN